MFEIKKYLRLKKLYLKESICESFPGAIESALCDIRAYLDSVGYHMPRPKYSFNLEDITTWKYLDIGRMNKRTGEVFQVYNPDFKFGHLV